MRWIVPVLCLAIVVGCASSSTGRIGTTRDVMQPLEEVWYAAIDAVNAFGARLVTENRSAGFIAARIGVDSLGSTVRIDISIQRRLGDTVEITVAASEPGHTSNDPERQQELQRIEEELLDMIYAAVGRMRAPIRRPGEYPGT